MSGLESTDVLIEISRHPTVKRVFEASRGDRAVYLEPEQTRYVAIALAVIAGTDPALVVPMAHVAAIRVAQEAAR